MNLSTDAKSKKREILAFVIAIAIALGLVVATGFSDQGFCFSQARFLKDEELIRPVVLRLATDGAIEIDKSYESASAFLQRNPRCCAVNRHPSWRMFIDVITGWNTAEIEVNYAMSSKNPLFRDIKYYKQFYAVSACGEPLKQERGTSTEILESVN